MYTLRILLFGLVLFAVLGGTSLYVHRRAAAAFGLGPRARRALGFAFGSILALGFFARAIAGRTVDRWSSGLGAPSYTFELALFVSAIVLALVELTVRVATTALAAARRLRAPSVAPKPAALAADGAPSSAFADPAPGPETPVEPARRHFLKQASVGGALLVGGGTAGYGALFGRWDYTLEEVVVKIPGLSKALDGLTLVQLSDIHLGVFVGDRELRSALELTRRAKPDLVVLTGDLIDYDLRHRPALTELAGRLGEIAPRGVFAIPGNHDHYAGVGRVLEAATRGGATVLNNAHRVLGDSGGRLTLAGVDDVQGRRTGAGPDLKRALEGAPPDVPRILLCHNPVFFPEASGEVALQLSGHTHGGQVNLVVRPADYVLPHGYVAGLYTRGASKLYVNRGFGTVGPPARVGSPPEITKIVLVAA